MPIEWNPKIKGGFKEGDLINLVKQVSPGDLVVCPYCRMMNIFPDGVLSRTCQDCGNVYFREVKKDA